jgi:hypothetical protein
MGRGLIVLKWMGGVRYESVWSLDGGVEVWV